MFFYFFFFFQAEDGIRDRDVTGVQTCALPIYENKAKLTLLERVRNANLNDYFGDVLVPTESVTENVKGQRRTTTRKFFPGYMFVQMVLDDRTFHLVKNTPKITGFLGGTKPTPVPEREITGVQTNMT